MVVTTFVVFRVSDLVLFCLSAFVFLESRNLWVLVSQIVLKLCNPLLFKPMCL